MIRKNTVAALLAVFGLYFGAPGLAEANFKIRTDNLATPYATSAWAAPNYTVDIQVFVTGNVSIDSGFITDSTKLGNHDQLYLNYNWTDVKDFCIFANSTDMYGIDRVQLLDGNGNVKQTWGADNEIAWCLSTDESQGYSADCNYNPWQRKYCFYTNGQILSQ